MRFTLLEILLNKVLHPTETIAVVDFSNGGRMMLRGSNNVESAVDRITENMNIDIETIQYY